MNAVASRPSTAAPLPYSHDPYGEIQSRSHPIACPMPNYAGGGHYQTPPASPQMSNFAHSPTPSIYSPTASSFSFRSFKPVQSNNPRPQVTPLRILPPEVYDYILAYLELSHGATDAEGCITCYLRDLHALSLTNRAWEKAVRNKLYNKIHIHGNDSPAQLKKYKWKRGSRLRLLRRTLRERRSLANAVFELRVPEVDVWSVSNGKQNGTLQEYRDLIASIVMVCPNLERLIGFVPPYAHEFDRLTHALSTRKKLKEHTWIISENAEIAERAKSQSSGLMDQGQVFQFLNFHTSWAHLDTLMLHSLDSKGILEHGVFLRMLNFLPSLRHLSVSGFDADDFTDRTLLFFPPLVSLRLEDLRGVTEHGLSRYTSRPEAHSLKSLTLIDQNITSLLLVSKILACLRSLEKFNFVQSNKTLTLPEGGMVFQPLLASRSLKHLHWDVAGPNPASSSLSRFDSIPTPDDLREANTPNSHLALSILHAGFPQLETLRAPLDIDPLGALQGVCRPTPNALIMIPSDRYSLPRSSHGSMPRRPLALPSGNNLTSARIRAQTLIDAAARNSDTGIKVVVTDHSSPFRLPLFSPSPEPTPESEVDDIHGILGPLNQKLSLATPPKPTLSVIKVHEFTLPACMGRICTATDPQVAPKTPKLNLTPDVNGSDADGGLISWKHLVSSNQTLSFAPSSLSLSVDRSNTGSSSIGDDVTSPSTTSSRFSGWGSGSSAGTSSSKSGNSAAAPPRTPTSPSTMSTSLSSIPSATSWGSGQQQQPFWSRDTCNGAWNNQRQKHGGKDWWAHVERERLPVGNNSDIVTLRQLF